MATQNLTTLARNVTYIHENTGHYDSSQASSPAELIDGIFTIPENIDTLALFDKLSERLNQLYAATSPPDHNNSPIDSNYLWMLQAITAQASGIADELYRRWRTTPAACK